VVQQVEEAVDPARPYDYVLVCVKVIPELYELADVIADVVTPSHTCILLNTTTTIGVEKSLGVRFPKNLIVSLVNFAELNQTGACEFEHLASPGGGADGGREGGAKVWIGTALRNETIPEETQQDMAESLALTLEAGSVDCHVSHNILQQQWEKMMGYLLPLSFCILLVVLTIQTDCVSYVECDCTRTQLQISRSRSLYKPYYPRSSQRVSRNRPSPRLFILQILHPRSHLQHDLSLPTTRKRSRSLPPNNNVPRPPRKQTPRIRSVPR